MPVALSRLALCLLSRQPPDYYDYDLVGVLVHNGTAEQGHYYSFVKVRLDEEHLLPDVLAHVPVRVPVAVAVHVQLSAVCDECNYYNCTRGRVLRHC